MARLPGSLRPRFAGYPIREQGAEPIPTGMWEKNVAGSGRATIARISMRLGMNFWDGLGREGMQDRVGLQLV